MRGLQLGAAIGARATSTPVEGDWQWADVVVLVKRAGRQWAEVARQHGVPVVWDALDFWRQPADNGLDETVSRQLIANELKTIRPALTIAATEAMALSADSEYLPHHGHIGLSPTAARERVRVVGYDGNACYLGRWAAVVETACQARGWQFVINPQDLSAVDILVAFRDGPWDGWMPREWKSGVKIVNALRAGRPIVTQESAAWRELQPCGSLVASMADLPDALDSWAGYEQRAAVVVDSEARADAFTVEAIGRRYLDLLTRVAA